MKRKLLLVANNGQSVPYLVMIRDLQPTNLHDSYPSELEMFRIYACKDGMLVQVDGRKFMVKYGSREADSDAEEVPPYDRILLSGWYPQAMEWIPVEEKLPDPGERVLVYNHITNRIDIATYDHDRNLWIGESNPTIRCIAPNDISHWAELPHPPEVGR